MGAWGLEHGDETMESGELELEDVDGRMVN